MSSSIPNQFQKRRILTRADINIILSFIIIIMTCRELLVLLIKPLDLLLKDSKVGIDLLRISLYSRLQPQYCVSMLWGKKIFLAPSGAQYVATSVCRVTLIIFLKLLIFIHLTFPLSAHSRLRHAQFELKILGLVILKGS